jgi:hypothetical protein
MKQADHSDTTDRPGLESSASRPHVLQRSLKTVVHGKMMKGARVILCAAFFIGIYVLANKRSQVNSEAHDTIPVANNPSLQVEVLDGAGSMKAAQHMTDFLRARGYDVVELKKNNSGIEERTFLFDRSGHREAARKLAAVLGVPPDKVFQKIDRTLYLDITVVMGKDYSRLNAFQSSTERTIH